MPVLLRGRRRAEGWLMATSETRMVRPVRRTRKGLNGKCWSAVGLRGSERKRRRQGVRLYIDAVDGVWEICDARNNRWAKRKMQLRGRRRTKAIAIDPGSSEFRSRAIERRKGRWRSRFSPRWGTFTKSCANAIAFFLFCGGRRRKATILWCFPTSSSDFLCVHLHSSPHSQFLP